jgi:hypothetical protein
MNVCCECLCCQVEVFASGWSLVQRSPTECGVSECDREASVMRRPWPTRGCCAKKRSYSNFINNSNKRELYVTQLSFKCVSMWLTPRQRPTFNFQYDKFRSSTPRPDWLQGIYATSYRKVADGPFSSSSNSLSWLGCRNRDKVFVCPWSTPFHTPVLARAAHLFIQLYLQMPYTFPHSFISFCPEGNFLLFRFRLLPCFQLLSSNSRRFDLVRHLIVCFSSVSMEFLFPFTIVFVWTAHRIRSRKGSPH